MTTKIMTTGERNKWACEFLGHRYYKSKDIFRSGFDSTYYCSDLNLAAQVEAKIPKNKQEIYRRSLWNQFTQDELHSGNKVDNFREITATAEQRIRAAYETMEGQNNV